MPRSAAHRTRGCPKRWRAGGRPRRGANLEALRRPPSRPARGGMPGDPDHGSEGIACEKPRSSGEGGSITVTQIVQVGVFGLNDSTKYLRNHALDGLAK